MLFSFLLKTLFTKIARFILFAVLNVFWFSWNKLLIFKSNKFPFTILSNYKFNFVELFCFFPTLNDLFIFLCFKKYSNL